jgi:hypothetical protein
MKKELFFIFLFICTCNILLGQKINFPIDTVFTKVRVTTTNWDEIKVPRLVLNTHQNSILLSDKYNKESIYQLSQIYSIEEQRGNRAWLFSILGGVSCFFISYSIAYLNDDPNDFDDGLSSSAIGAIIIGGTGFGFTIGFLTGMSSKKYKKVYYDGEFLID